MSELIANTDFEISVTPSGAWTPGDPNSTSDMSLTVVQANKAEAPNGKPIIVDSVSWVVIPTACTLASNTHI